MTRNQEKMKKIDKIIKKKASKERKKKPR